MVVSPGQIELFVEHLQAPTVNEKIFPQIVSGFMDTNPVVRESTIKVGLCVVWGGGNKKSMQLF